MVSGRHARKQLSCNDSPKFVDNVPQTARVYGLPTLMLIKDGKVVDGSKHEGVITKVALEAYLKKHGVA